MADPGWEDDPWLYAMYVGGDHRVDPGPDDDRIVRLGPPEPSD